jgi:hypothetical protein
MTYACPCCGYKTLPDRGAYDLCPVCWWEDEGTEPWDVSDPNGRTLVEAQQEFLAQRLPYRLRPGKVRAPRRGEERDPDWQPFELTEELAARVERSKAEWRRQWDEEERRAEEAMAQLGPEHPFEEFNAALRALGAEAGNLSHREVEERLRALVTEHRLPFGDAELELVSRGLQDEHWYRRHPVRAAWWLLRYSRPRTLARRFAELRTGSFRFAG